MNESREKVFTFSNGLKLITLHLPEKRKIGMIVAVGAGSIHETSETDGAAHFTEHMLFKSNRHRSRGQLLRNMEWNGIQPGAATDRDSTHFRIISPPRAFGDAIQIAYEAYRNLDYRQEELEAERGVVITEINRCAENPGHHLIHNLLMPYYFKDTDLERNVFGQVNAIANISCQDMADFKARHYIPQKTVIAVAGNFEEPAVLAKIEETFGQLPKSSFSEAKPNVTVSSLKRKPLYEARKGVGQIYLGQIMEAADRFGGEDYYGLRLLETAIGRDMCCRLFEELREKRGIGYLVSSMYQDHPENCIILYAGGVEPKRINETRQVLDNIMGDIAANGLPEEELEGVRCKAISLLQDRLENLDEINIALFRKAMYGFTCSLLDEEEGYKKITAESLRLVSQKYLTRPRLEACVIPAQ